jgi:hypothetical protein
VTIWGRKKKLFISEEKFFGPWLMKNAKIMARAIIMAPF